MNTVVDHVLGTSNRFVRTKTLLAVMGLIYAKIIQNKRRKTGVARSPYVVVYL